MKISPRWLMSAGVALMVATSCSAQEPALTTTVDQVSYLIGRNIGDSLAGDELAGEINLDILCAALREGVAKKPMAIAPEKAQEIMQTFSTHMREKVNKLRDEQGAANQKDGAEFLAKNAKEEGWKTTDSGLQYKVITEGNGPKPTAEDMVEVNYRGSLLNGQEFDSSYKRGEAAVFPVGQVIQGWQEALQMMPVGSKWDVVVPSDLAYGPNGKGREIGPNAVLRFEVELLAIKEKPAAGPEGLPQILPAAPQGNRAPRPGR